MYPYDDNPETGRPEGAAGENSSASPAEDGSYRMTRPDAGKSFDEKQSDTDGARGPCYRDANYTSENPDGPGASASFYSPATQRRESKPRKARRGMPAAAVVALCLVCALVGGGFGGVIANSLAPAEEEGGTSLVQTTPPVTTGSGINSDSGAMSATDIYYNLALKQVVGISSEITTGNLWGIPMQNSVSGTGFVISSDGYILTNYHVIEDAYSTGSDINVMFSDDSGYETKEYTAEVVGFERSNDVAVIKIDATGLTAATLGSSSDLLVGDTVYAVGNPLGELAYSMTPGIVSATDRMITTSEGTANMFQISAAVNEGNSGGPVYNAYGQVVGIVTAKPNANSTSSGEGTEGIGFAIPIDDAVRIADNVINGGHSLNADGEPAYMGIQGYSVDDNAITYYRLPAGAFISYVEAGSPADKAGVQVGDIITEVDGYEIQSYEGLAEELAFHRAGDTVDIVVYRSGESVTLSITFGADTQDEDDGGGVLNPGVFG